MTVIEPGQAVRHHNHGKSTDEEGAEEVYILIEGKSQVRVDEEEFEAEAIEAFYFTPDVFRSVYNHSDKPATWIFIAPMRETFKESYSKAD
jgi:oxalate decarboxylase/phosphoglucose isomerase-like protein (cupin superfamily)